MRLAIVADWLTTPGGAEQVIQEFTLLYPDAPLFTTVARDDFFPKERHKIVHRSHLQKLYRLLPHHQVLLAQMPRAIEDLDVRGFDSILSSSHAVGKGIIPSPGTLHACYCHTPMRYAWEMENDYLRDFRVPSMLHKTIKGKLRELRRWDLTTAKRVDLFFANSTTTQERIQRIYNRESIVIPPPVGDRFFEAPIGRHESSVSSHETQSTQDSRLKTHNYFLAVGRFVPYKRFDLLIELANKLKLPLKIAGRGQDEQRLKAMAGPTVEFLGFVADEQLPALYANAHALFFPQVEDAGIVLLEAQACGTPVIAFNAGGARDAVKDRETGLFFAEQTVASLEDALRRFETIAWNRPAIRQSTQPFSRIGFRCRIQHELSTAYDAFLRRKTSYAPIPVSTPSAV